jgi:hypothetical protein
MATPQETRRHVEGSQIGIGLSVAQELAGIPDEPFLPVEAKLVAWSLGLGAILLVLLVWASYTFFAG